MNPNIIGWLEAVELPPWIECYRDETLTKLAAMVREGIDE